MPADERVTRYSFAHSIHPISVPFPMPSLPRRIWSAQEWERIQVGYHSHDMEEKWDVFAEDDVVFLCRSWTGFITFEARFEPTEGASWRIAEALVERDQTRYRVDDDEHDRLTLEVVLSSIVLGEPASELRAEFRSSLSRISSSRGDTQHG